MVIRTRFAPSPTGFLHIGGVRTALFSWLFARHNKGEFLLRIEDTDQERSTQASVDAILQGMAWLDLNYDKKPIYQSERYARYQSIAEQLLQEGQAYYCDCSKERLEELREKQLAAKEKPRYDGHCRERHLMAANSNTVIRFKNPKTGNVFFHDEVYGDINVSNEELDDLILIRSDGNPTYNFAVVIDDWDMEITHVIRGDDHINNTPRQINLFKALNAPLPVFAHLPMILGEDGKRLSKRHGAVSVLQFKELGFLPHALLNYLVRLGWSHGDQEIFSVTEMIDAFNLRAVNRGVSNFNYDKLNWLNQHYIKTEPPFVVAKALAWQFDHEGIDVKNGPDLLDLIAVQADRCKTLAEMCNISHYFYQDSIHYNEEAQEKYLTPNLLPMFKDFLQRLQTLETWDKETLQGCLKSVMKDFNLSMGQIAQPLRVMMTGNIFSPSIDATLALLGKERTLSRLQQGLQYLSAQEEG